MIEVSPDLPWLDYCPCLNDHGRNLAIAKIEPRNELWEIIYVSVILLAMFAVLLTDKVGADWAMLTALTLFMVSKTISISEGLAGFSNEGLLTVLVLFVVAEGISRTGALDWYMGKLLGNPKTIAGAQIRLMVPIAALSAFLNNTPIVAVMIPITLRWAKHIGVPRQQLLMPLSFATILGGTCTLIGTSTNLVVVGFLKDNYPDDSEIGLFDLGEFGVPVAIVGLTYILIVAPFFLPFGRNSKGLDSAQDSDALLLGARLTPWSPAAGRSVKRSGLRDSGGIYLVSVHRAATGNVHRSVSPDFVLSVGDVLYFTGLIEGFGEFCEEHGLEVVTNEVSDAPEINQITPTIDSEAIPKVIMDSHLSNIPEGTDVNAEIVVEVGVTKESMLECDYAHRLRSINWLTDQIRGQSHSDPNRELLTTRTKLHSAVNKRGTDPPKIVVTTDTYDNNGSVLVGVDAPDRPGLLLDISKGLLRLHLQLKHTEAKVIGERSLSIWRCECIAAELPDFDEVWSVLSALLENSNGIEAIKKRGLRVIRAVVTMSSRLIGSTAADVNFRETYKAAIVTVQRGGKNTSTSVTFEAGDVLILQAADDSPLLQGPPAANFYENLENTGSLSRKNSIANLMKIGGGRSARGDVNAPGKSEILSENLETDDIESGADGVQNSETGVTYPQQHISEMTTTKSEEAWKDLRVVFANDEDSPSEVGAYYKEFLTAMEIAPKSSFEKKTIAQLGISKLPGVYLVSIERPVVRERDIPASTSRGGAGDGTGSVDVHSILNQETIRYTAISQDDPLQIGDILWFSGSASAVGDLRRIPGLQSSQDDEVQKINSNVQERRLVQAVIAKGGLIVGKTVKEVRFRTHYGAAVIAVHREGNRVHDHPGNIKLQAGDVLLLEAGPTFISKNAENDRSFALLAEVEDSAPPRLRLFALAVFLTVTMLAVYTIQGTSLLITALIAGILMVAFGILSQQEARDAIKWDIFVTIGAAFGISSALSNSGVAGGLAGFLVNIGTAVGIGGKFCSKIFGWYPNKLNFVTNVVPI